MGKIRVGFAGRRICLSDHCEFKEGIHIPKTELLLSGSSQLTATNGTRMLIKILLILLSDFLDWITSQD